MSITAPVFSTIDFIVAPPLPITAAILDWSTFIVVYLGAYLDVSSLGVLITLFISSKICSLACLA